MNFIGNDVGARIEELNIQESFVGIKTRSEIANPDSEKRFQVGDVGWNVGKLVVEVGGFGFSRLFGVGSRDCSDLDAETIGFSNFLPRFHVIALDFLYGGFHVVLHGTL